MLPGVGPKTLEKLKKLNITVPTDLIYHFPSRYIDFSHISSIKEAQLQQNTSVSGQLTSLKNIYTKTGKFIQIGQLLDQTGVIQLLWFNQPYLINSLKIGDIYSVAGEVSLYFGKKTIISPFVGCHNTGKIIAIYPETKGLTSAWFRKTIQNNLFNLTKDIVDPIPEKFLKSAHLIDLKSALKIIHSPKNQKELNQAKTRLSLQEIMSLQGQSYLSKKEWLTLSPAKKFNNFEKEIQKTVDKFPFKLTPSQSRVWAEISSDLLNQNKPCNRLLQGDVGSGKTVIALLGTQLASLNKTLSVFLAPTEILALQHFSFFKKYLKNVYFLSSKVKLKIKELPKNAIIISTHAAIYQSVDIIPNLGLLIIDEQHKFGVTQRSQLLSKTNPPHVITMTATPIPRTISLTILGNLDLSVIDELPKNRLPIKTKVINKNEQTKYLLQLAAHLKKTKEQAFIVCPFIDISESMATVHAATDEFEKLTKLFPDIKLALIHGKIKSQTRQKILNDFAKNKIHILVTTPIIEVGIDFPNATNIIILSSERFGLSSLHQLRGRVGRGDLQSYCYLFANTPTPRLNFLETNQNGLKIAEYDLKIRGPGDAFSTIQHGFPSLKIASFSDLKLINISSQLLSSLLKLYPDFDVSKLVCTPLQSLHPNN